MVPCHLDKNDLAEGHLVLILRIKKELLTNQLMTKMVRVRRSTRPTLTQSRVNISPVTQLTHQTQATLAHLQLQATLARQHIQVTLQILTLTHQDILPPFLPTILLLILELANPTRQATQTRLRSHIPLHQSKVIPTPEITPTLIHPTQTLIHLTLTHIRT